MFKYMFKSIYTYIHVCVSVICPLHVSQQAVLQAVYAVICTPYQLCLDNGCMTITYASPKNVIVLTKCYKNEVEPRYLKSNPYKLQESYKGVIEK